MANEEQLRILKQGPVAWNAWRQKAGRKAYIDLNKADLNKADLSRADLSRANLSGTDLWLADLGWADLREANLSGANLRVADLSGAFLSRAYLSNARLVGARLVGADLSRAFLREADLRGANLRGGKLVRADLCFANLTEADLTEADLTGCLVFGVSAWGLRLSASTKQQGLIITRAKPHITTDDIEIAQFLYLLIHNEKLRKFIDTITSKVVLILGNFSKERKAVLDALRDEVRKRNYLPVIFDFEKSASRTIDETVTLLARMARFVIADLSDAKSVLQELRGVVPDLPSVPVQPLILASQDEPGMFDFFSRYPWVLTTYRYVTQEHLLANLDAGVVAPAEAKARELQNPQPPAPAG
jgi:hypothetical protein